MLTSFSTALAVSGFLVGSCTSVCLEKLMPHCYLPFLHNNGLLFVFFCVPSMYFSLTLPLGDTTNFVLHSIDLLLFISLTT